MGISSTTESSMDDLPDHWEHFERTTKTETGRDVPLRGFHAPANGRKTTFVFISGLKSRRREYIEFAKFLNSIGIGFLQITLPSDSPPKTLIEDFMAIPKAVYAGDNSVVKEFIPEDHMKIGMGHSTGALVSLATMLGIQKGKASPELLEISKKMTSYLDGFVHVAPFFDTANSSRMHHRLKSIFYCAYSFTFGKFKAAGLWTDRVWLRAKGTPEENIEWLKEHGPTHGQNRVVKKEGQRLEKAITSQAKSGDLLDLSKKLPQLFLHSDNDHCACHRTSAYLANLLGAQLITMEGLHDPFNDDGGKYRDQCANLIFDFIKSIRIGQMGSLERSSINTPMESLGIPPQPFRHSAHTLH